MALKWRFWYYNKQIRDLDHKTEIGDFHHTSIPHGGDFDTVFFSVFILFVSNINPHSKLYTLSLGKILTDAQVTLWHMHRGSGPVMEWAPVVEQLSKLNLQKHLHRNVTFYMGFFIFCWIFFTNFKILNIGIFVMDGRLSILLLVPILLPHHPIYINRFMKYKVNNSKS